MPQVLIRSVAIGALTFGALLGASATAAAGPSGHIEDGAGDYMDDDLPPLAVFEGPGDFTYCPPGFHIAEGAIPIPGVPMGCEPSVPVVAIPEATLAVPAADGHTRPAR